jgi:hypothetical protein
MSSAIDGLRTAEGILERGWRKREARMRDKTDKRDKKIKTV